MIRIGQSQHSKLPLARKFILSCSREAKAFSAKPTLTYFYIVAATKKNKPVESIYKLMIP